jgi:hypothetical protein
VFAFTLAMERKGLLTRSEVAEALRYVIKDVAAQEGVTARTVVAELMLQAFDAPAAGADARSRLRVIDGGAPG